ncbi:MAG TPA: insulinase family protein, partial [Myxococcaceae bacterium]|nr:insulinase family protein [Myxococcaceae bacterium]
QSITLDDVKAHWARVFTQDRAVLGLAGAVDRALEARMKKRFSALPLQGAPIVELPPAAPVHNRTLILKKEALSTAVSLGYVYGLRRGDHDFFPVAVALSYLGEHRQQSGVLFRELRERRGLNYGDYAYPEHFHQEGWGTIPQTNVVRRQQDLSLWIRPVEPRNAVFATRAALYFFDQLAQNGLDPKQFEVTRGFLQGYTRLWEQTDQRRLGYAIDALFYGTPNFLESYRQALSTMTPEQVQQAAQRHLRVRRFNQVYVAQDAEGLAEKLKSGAPSPIQYPTPKDPSVLQLDPTLAQVPLPVDPAKVQILDAQTFMER